MTFLPTSSHAEHHNLFAEILCPPIFVPLSSTPIETASHGSKILGCQLALHSVQISGEGSAFGSLVLQEGPRLLLVRAQKCHRSLILSVPLSLLTFFVVQTPQEANEANPESHRSWRLRS